MHLNVKNVVSIFTYRYTDPTEIMKLNSYGNYGYKLYYWRLRQGAEVDIVLKKEGTFIGIEVKYVGGKISRAFMNRYPQAKSGVVTAKNFY